MKFRKRIYQVVIVLIAMISFIYCTKDISQANKTIESKLDKISVASSRSSDPLNEKELIVKNLLENDTNFVAYVKLSIYYDKFIANHKDVIDTNKINTLRNTVNEQDLDSIGFSNHLENNFGTFNSDLMQNCTKGKLFYLIKLKEEILPIMSQYNISDMEFVKGFAEAYSNVHMYIEYNYPY